jgi:hypothetical protein
MKKLSKKSIEIEKAADSNSVGTKTYNNKLLFGDYHV